MKMAKGNRTGEIHIWMSTEAIVSQMSWLSKNMTACCKNEHLNCRLFQMGTSWKECSVDIAQAGKDPDRAKTFFLKDSFSLSVSYNAVCSWHIQVILILLGNMICVKYAIVFRIIVADVKKYCDL